MRRLIQVLSRPGFGSAQPSITSPNALSTVTVEAVRAHGARQAGGDFQAVERDDAALFRLDPEQGRIVGAFRHREDAAGIGAQQHLRRDLGLHGVA